MEVYGHVHFDRGGLAGALQQNEVMRLMASESIISISDAQLLQYFKDDTESLYGGNQTYKLHNLKEIIHFRRAIKQYKRGLPHEYDIQWWIDRKHKIGYIG